MNINSQISFGESQADRDARMARYRKTCQDSILRQEKQRYVRLASDYNADALQHDIFIPSVEKDKAVDNSQQKGKNIFSKLIDKIKGNK